MPSELAEGEDYYLEGGFMVFTAAYHHKRGYCCGNGCRHCPYEGDHDPSGLDQPSICAALGAK